MRTLKYFTIIIILMSVVSAAVLAQEEEEDTQLSFVDDSKRFEVSFSYLMQSSGINFLHLADGKDSVESYEMSRTTLEFTIAYYFSRYKNLGVEAMFGYTFASGFTQIPGDSFDPDNPVVFPVDIVDHKVFTYQGNVIYNFGYLDFVPYLIVGAGINQIKPSEGSAYALAGTYPNLTVGFGIKYFLKEWIGARMQVTDNYLMISNENSYGKANQFRLSIGVVLAF